MKELPLFPLKLVAFPGEKLNLHIYEERYRLLVQDCVHNDLTFGIPPYVDDMKMRIGTELKIKEIVHTYDDGRMDIKTLGLSVFEILKFDDLLKDKPYPGGQVKEIEQDYQTDLVLLDEVLKKIEELYEIMQINKNVPKVSPQFHIFSIAHKIGLNINQEINLLSLTNEIERLNYVNDHLDRLLPMVNEMESMRIKVQMNGHFKNVIPPDFKLK